jgi:hypothetical protein
MNVHYFYKFIATLLTPQTPLADPAFRPSGFPAGNGINRLTINAHFVVKVRPGGKAG